VAGGRVGVGQLEAGLAEPRGSLDGAPGFDDGLRQLLLGQLGVALDDQVASAGLGVALARGQRYPNQTEGGNELALVHSVLNTRIPWGLSRPVYRPKGPGPFEAPGGAGKPVNKAEKTVGANDPANEKCRLLPLRVKPALSEHRLMSAYLTAVL